MTVPSKLYHTGNVEAIRQHTKPLLRSTVYYMIISWLFHLGISWTVVVLTCFVMCGCVYVWVLECVGVLVICVLVFAVFCIVCTVFFVLFVYIYFFLFVLSVLPPSDNSIAVCNNNNNNNNNNISPLSRMYLSHAQCMLHVLLITLTIASFSVLRFGTNDKLNNIDSVHRAAYHTRKCNRRYQNLGQNWSLSGRYDAVHRWVARRIPSGFLRWSTVKTKALRSFQTG
jgi:hypothetical protein